MCLYYSNPVFTHTDRGREDYRNLVKLKLEELFVCLFVLSEHSCAGIPTGSTVFQAKREQQQVQGERSVTTTCCNVLRSSLQGTASLLHYIPLAVYPFYFTLFCVGVGVERRPRTWE